MEKFPLHTVGTIARRLGQPIHRIEYLIRARGIAALGTAGNSRVYSDSAVEAIAEELSRIDLSRAAVPGGKHAS